MTLHPAVFARLESLLKAKTDTNSCKEENMYNGWEEARSAMTKERRKQNVFDAIGI